MRASDPERYDSDGARGSAVGEVFRRVLTAGTRAGVTAGATAGAGTGRRAARTGLVAATVILVLAGNLLVATPAWAAPAPPPSPSPAPPNPSDQQLRESKGQVSAAAGQVGALTGQLAAAQAEADRLGSALEVRQESANRALVDLHTAQDAAQVAAARVSATRTEALAAAGAIEQAQRRLDQFLAVAYEQGVQSGAFGLLMQAGDPDELIGRAELTQSVADDQRAAMDGLRQAQVARANADSLARAAQLDADAKRAAAAGAKHSADVAVAGAFAALRQGEEQLTAVDARKADLEHQLDVLTAQDAGLRAQRQQYLNYQAQVAAQLKAEAAAAAGRVSGGLARVGGGIRGVIDRALSQVGVTYAWGGGTSGGPSRGIRDGGVADRFGDFRKTGFDCSGLMLYAFGGLGVGLPHYSGYQYNAGKKIPISQVRPGDMLFWAEGGDIHHVALYIGDDKMVEAPYSGGSVRIVPVRHGGGLMPYATRMVG